MKAIIVIWLLALNLFFAALPVIGMVVVLRWVFK